MMTVLSAWPTQPLKVPTHLCRHPESTLVDVEGEPVIMERGPLHWVAKHERNKDYSEWLPPEPYLWELMDLDLGNAAQILAFVQTWGSVRLDDMGTAFLEHLARAETIDMHRTRFAKMAEAARAAGLEGAALPVAEVRFVLGSLRDAVRALLANVGTITEAQLVADHESVFGYDDDLYRLGRGTEVALRSAIDLVNSGLAPFTPRLAFAGENPEDMVLPSLYSALCLTIINDVIQGSTFRTCAKCGRVFVRQRGRAAYAQHRRRGVVRFCSRRCADAAAAQAYRDRKKGAHNA